MISIRRQCLLNNLMGKTVPVQANCGHQPIPQVNEEKIEKTMVMVVSGSKSQLEPLLLGA